MATATKMATVIRARRRAQIRNRRRREIIMVGSEVVITRIILRRLVQRRGQTFRRLRHHPVRLHLPQHLKRQREDLPERQRTEFRCRFVFVRDVRSSFGLRQMRQRTGRQTSNSIQRGSDSIRDSRIAC